MSRVTWSVVLVGVFLAGCEKRTLESRVDTGASAEDGMPYCEDSAAAMVPEDVSSFGVSGQAFLDSIPAGLDGSAAFADGGNAGLQVQVEVDPTTLQSVGSVAVYPETDGPVPSIAVICPDRMEVQARVSLITDDGRLAETLDLVLVTEDPAELGGPAGQVSLSAELDPGALGGTLDIADFTDLDEWDSVSMSARATILDGTLTGEVSGMGEVVNGEVAMAGAIPMATLQAVAAEGEGD